ncbi:MAG: c-type cytochrome [Planctomycetales bacterium]|nr:c-type cytochrome [Planctomycetales bacterium]
MTNQPCFSLRSPIQVLLLALGCLVALSFGDVAVGEEQPSKIHLPPGFSAELVYSVPIKEQGSWVSMALDEKGRIIASDQYGHLYRITPSAIGADPAKTKVEKIEVHVGGAQGLLVHNGALYAVVSTSEGGYSQGLYRVTDSDGDDKFDRAEKLLSLAGGGEHGPHAILLAPDGKSLYLCAGNHTKLPQLDSSRVPQNWDEDQLLPRIVDPRGHAVGIKAPGGWICKLDFDGKQLELISVGYRNEYDIAFNDEGELFTFDADMEWDIGTPWFRPTRVCHAVSGSDFGWRTGNGKWPIYFPDTLPPVVDIGPGSPTGITFGAKTNFPEHYQQALFMGDWSYGNIYAVYLAPQGSTYTATFEPFASAMPLAVTDIVVRPQDGSIYFTVGGRRTESALYRIVYDGKPRPAPERPTISPEDEALARNLRGIRHQLEKLHSASAPQALDEIWPHLASEDRFIRYAARVALEHQSLDDWRARGLAEEIPSSRLAALLALVRSGTPGIGDELISSLTALDWDALDDSQQLELLRIAELAIIRCQLGAEELELLSGYLSPLFPHGDHRLDRELSQLLVKLEAPGAVPRALEQLQAAVTSEQQIDFAIALSVAEKEWTIPRRKVFFDWFQQIAKSYGGNSYFGYLERARARFVDTFSDEERTALAAEIDAQYGQADASTIENSRPLVKKWTVAELTELAENPQGKPDFQRGRQNFALAQCSKCHRVAGAGSSLGPDLTGAGGRLSQKDLIQAIVEPSHQISDQYQQMVFETNGRVIVGRILNLWDDEVAVSSNMADPKTLTTIKREEIDRQYPSKESIMPAGLLDSFESNDILDLLAFLRSGGNAEHPLFQPQTSSSP